MPTIGTGSKSAFVQFRAYGLAEAINILRAMPDTVRIVSSSYLESLATGAEKYMKDETPKDSGRLSRSTLKRKRSTLAFQIIQTETSGAGRSNSSFFYGRAVRMGSRPHKIFPRAGNKALYWEAKKGSRGLDHPIPFVGPPVTAIHPGTKKPYNYVDATVAKLQPRIATVARLIAADIRQGAYKGFRTVRI